jgi:hypothetical protein
VDILQVVAGGVVAGVLVTTSTGEEARGWDAGLDEGEVVGGRAEGATVNVSTSSLTSFFNL